MTLADGTSIENKPALLALLQTDEGAKENDFCINGQRIVRATRTPTYKDAGLYDFIDECTDQKSKLKPTPEPNKKAWNQKFNKDRSSSSSAFLDLSQAKLLTLRYGLRRAASRTRTKTEDTSSTAELTKNSSSLSSSSSLSDLSSPNPSTTTESKVPFADTTPTSNNASPKRH